MNDQNPPVPGIELSEVVELKRGELLTLPEGAKPSAFKPSSPPATYTEFATERGRIIRFTKPKDPPVGDGDQQTAGGE